MVDTISCFIPAYNAARHLAAAIDSVLAQTLPPDEIIIVDDGSNDDTSAVASAYGERVVYLHQDNRGSAAARNTGLRASKGDFLASLDADDIWPAQRLALQMRHLRSSPETELCVGHAQNFRDGENTREGEPFLAYSLNATLVRRAVFDAIGLLNAELRHADQLDWFLRARKKNIRTLTLTEVVLLRRLHSGSLSDREADMSRREHMRVLHQFTRAKD